MLASGGPSAPTPPLAADAFPPPPPPAGRDCGRAAQARRNAPLAALCSAPSAVSRVSTATNLGVPPAEPGPHSGNCSYDEM